MAQTETPAYKYMFLNKINCYGNVHPSIYLNFRLDK